MPITWLRLTFLGFDLPIKADINKRIRRTEPSAYNQGGEFVGVTLPDTSDVAISTPPFFFEIQQIMATLQTLTELQRLNECAYECTKQSRWKETTQRYLANMLQNNGVDYLI